MNKYPTTTQKPLAPFAAKIVFKPTHRYQKIHDNWTFRSDQFCQINAASEHYKALERLILKDFQGTFICASLFDNRKEIINVPGQKKNNLVLQVSYNTIWVDKRHELDLSFLKPTICQNFAEVIAESFKEQNEVLMESPLQKALREYKQLL